MFFFIEVRYYYCQRFGALRRLGLEVQMFKFSTLFIRIPNVQFSTEAQLLQNPCPRCTTPPKKQKPKKFQ